LGSFSRIATPRFIIIACQLDAHYLTKVSFSIPHPPTSGQAGGGVGGDVGEVASRHLERVLDPYDLNFHKIAHWWSIKGYFTFCKSLPEWFSSLQRFAPLPWRLPKGILTPEFDKYQFLIHYFRCAFDPLRFSPSMVGSFVFLYAGTGYW